MFKRKNTPMKLVKILIVLVILILPLASASIVQDVQAEEFQSDAVVLVNSTSPSYGDFQHYIQPYLDNFGVPYTMLDIATEPVGADLGDYALIIVGHRELDPGLTYLDPTEQGNISTAVNAGTGIVNFDNDLSVGGTTARYQFIDDIFNFGYSTPGSGSGVTFTSEGGAGYQINLWEDDHQDPDLVTTTNVLDLTEDDNLWTEFEYTARRLSCCLWQL